jgi:hypothetical protein
MPNNKSGTGTLLPLTEDNRHHSRRKFLGYGAMAATGLAIVISSCDKDDDKDSGIDLGMGDFGILNYAYALEQLEAAFYTRVLQSPYSGGSTAELALIADIRDHEIAHREFFKNALGTNKIQELQVDFSSINFADRSSVLGAAKSFEDLGVSAYNGAGKLITNGAYLTLAGKIVSVEARHAAYIRDLISNGSFADNTVIDANGLDKSRTPAEVLAMANVYLTTKVSARNLPTS